MDTRSTYHKSTKTESITVDEYFNYIRGGKIIKAPFQRRNGGHVNLMVKNTINKKLYRVSLCK